VAAPVLTTGSSPFSWLARLFGEHQKSMILATQKAMRAVKQLPFCYLCGERLTDPRNDDHIPPSSIFLRGDRDFPLILPTHVRCNSDRSLEDQVIGQLIGFLHGKAPHGPQNKLWIKGGRFKDGTPGIAVQGLDLRAIIRRWIRGFHAALYREFLPDGLFLTSPPLPEWKPLEDDGQVVPVSDVVPHFVEELKRNRATNTLDRIRCRNAKCRYDCVWIQADRGAWLCIYGLDLYDWIKLGDTRHF
jgi:hypothetical protein